MCIDNEIVIDLAANYDKSSYFCITIESHRKLTAKRRK